jgi:hypothetical protein
LFDKTITWQFGEYENFSEAAGFQMDDDAIVVRVLELKSGEKKNLKHGKSFKEKRQSVDTG